MKIPAYLKPGDKVAIVSPASHIKPDYVTGACEVLEQWGYVPVVSKHCTCAYGGYSGTLEERLEDIRNAFLDPEIKAILCSRGGYGAVHLVEGLTTQLIADNPKWIIGFSDISVLHAMANRAGVASIHGSMTKQLALFGVDNECNKTMHNLLEGKMPTYTEISHEYNRQGTVTGEVVGGNMAVLCGLLQTDVNIFKPGKILFIEDVGESIYRVERFLYNLRLAGVLPNLKGLIVGRFTEYEEPDGNGDTMNSMIYRMVKDYDYPMAFNFPIGHVDENVPIVEGATATLIVDANGSTLKF